MHFGTVDFTRRSTKTQHRLGVVLKAPIGRARAVESGASRPRFLSSSSVENGE